MNGGKTGPNDGLSCTPGDGALDGDFPTSHDCPPPPASNIGALPIAFKLDTEASTLAAPARWPPIARARPVRSPRGRAARGAAAGRTPASPARRERTARAAPARGRYAECVGHCPSTASNPGATCNVKNCGTGGTCVAGTCSGGPNPGALCCVGANCLGAFVSCAQRTSGAFTPLDTARTIVETGVPAGARTTGGAAKPSKLGSIFCIPPSFTPTVDAAADLPAPGAVALDGQAQALP